MYSFTNHFSRSTLYQRVGMMNRCRSGPATWVRYVLWAGLLGIMALACRHKNGEYEFVSGQVRPAFPLTNATRVLANELDGHGMPWFRQSSLTSLMTSDKPSNLPVRLSSFNYPTVLSLKNDRLTLHLPEGKQAKLFINGQEVSKQALSALLFEEVEELFVYEKRDDATGADNYLESYRIFISTSHQKPGIDPVRANWKRYLRAASISDHPLGQASTFTMNKLLEATFFHNERAFVGRTKNNCLTLLDAYSKNIGLYINGLPVTPDDIAKVHVREVDRLYANERSFEEWTGDGPNRKSRFILYIQTMPKRAKRDSTYYVFSPFYTGDF